MKIVVIHGSMRRGNTYAVTQEIIKQLAIKRDVEFTEFSVAELNLPFCRSCHSCLLRGEEYCPHREIMRPVQLALAECDGVIFAAPTYMWGVNAAMKNVIDHLAYLFHRPELFGKKGMVVVTATGAGAKGVAKYLKMVLGFWGVNGAWTVLHKTKNHNAEPGAALQLTKKEMAIAEYFYNDIKSDKRISPNLKTIATYNAFRVMSLSEWAESPCDTAFWQRDGFYNRAYPIKIGKFKYFMGRVVYGAVKHTIKIVGRQYKRKLKRES